MIQMSNERAKQIADTILLQMGGGNKLRLMIGAKEFTYRPDGSLTFRHMQGLRKITRCLIEYDEGRDLYNMSFYKWFRHEWVEVHRMTGIYADMLQDIFEGTTGLCLTMPRVKGINA